MESEELKIFEKIPEGIVLFNEDGSLDYINEVGASWLWGYRKSDELYDAMKDLVNYIACNAQHDPIMVTFKNKQAGGEVKCSISRVNGYVLVVLGKDLDDKPRSFGIPSPVGVIRDKLCLMSTVYVGGGSFKVRDNHMV